MLYNFGRVIYVFNEKRKKNRKLLLDHIIIITWRKQFSSRGENVKVSNFLFNNNYYCKDMDMAERKTVLKM